ncbi:MAG TPA: chorismate mutase, partial [Acidimicrobiia bacterium]|nr:chorismate mutase [Acidimicrobiia bacterium]
MTGLHELRARIDELDQQLVRVLAERLAICEEVARVKEGSDTPVIQPARVRDVITTRRQWAIDDGVDPDFAEQVFRVLLAETHRIEVAGGRPDAAPDKSAEPESARSALDTVATRIDHVAIVVEHLEAAVQVLTEQLGFHDVPLAGGEQPGMRAVAAGGV